MSFYLAQLIPKQPTNIQMKNISEISKALAILFGEEKGRSISQILVDCLGINKDIVHLLMVIECLGLMAIIGGIIYFVVKKLKKCSKK